MPANQLESNNRFESIDNQSLEKPLAQEALRAETTSQLDQTRLSVSIENTGKTQFLELLKQAKQKPRKKYKNENGIFRVRSRDRKKRKKIVIEEFTTLKRGFSGNKGFKQRFEVKFNTKNQELTVARFSSPESHKAHQSSAMAVSPALGAGFDDPWHAEWSQTVKINSPEAQELLQTYVAPALAKTL